MRWWLVLIGSVLLVIGIWGWVNFRSGDSGSRVLDEEVIMESKDMKLSSAVFDENGMIPAKYTCDGVNVNPLLAISDVPEGAKSLLLMVDDPDAPAGDWVHWLVWNISPDVAEVGENSVPAGAVQGTTSFGKNEYGGPCPPSGTHRYQFKLYALSEELDLGLEAKKADVERAMEGKILDQVMLVGRYGR